MTSSVERKENDSDDDMYILWVYTVDHQRKKKKNEKKKTGHTHVTQNRRQKSK